MVLSPLDIIVFVAFVVAVVSIGLWKSRHEKTGEDYFLAGRGLGWWLIGFSLIAANISTEQFVGMSGDAAKHVGLAIASYEWMAAVTLVIVAFAFLPYFLRAGIYTMPEFLEYRYNAAARTIMAVGTILIYMLLLGAVTYSGALTIRTIAAKMGHNVPLEVGSLVIGLIAMVYVAAGGLKACAWADLIQGSALIIGGAIIMFFAFDKLGNADQAAHFTNVATGEVAVQELAPESGAVERFWDLNRNRMNMFLPSTDPILPWTALLLGLWIPNFYYWGLNQYITQRTLGSKSLSQGQRGIVFAAALKLLIPFFIVVPGIIAFNLFAPDMARESARDNAPVIAKYLKANPDTEYVEVVESPSEQAIENWPEGRFMIALYAEEAAVMETRQNQWVLPMTQAAYAATEPEPYTLFKTEDSAAPTVMAGLVEETAAYNEQVQTQAKQAGAELTTEKFIAFKYDTAMGQLLANVLPQRTGLLGFVLAALLGAVVSSLAAMLNAASTIFTMDIYKKYISPAATQRTIVLLGRLCVVAFSIVAVVLAPRLGNPAISNSIFTIIQGGQGLISPGILAVFVFGLLFRRAPGAAGVAGLLTNIIAYSVLWWVSTVDTLMENEMAAYLLNNFLNRMAICFVLCLLVMAFITIVKPLPQPVVFEQKTTLDLKGSRGALFAGVLVVLVTICLYILFSPLVLARG